MSVIFSATVHTSLNGMAWANKGTVSDGLVMDQLHVLIVNAKYWQWVASISVPFTHVLWFT